MEHGCTCRTCLDTIADVVRVVLVEEGHYDECQSDDEDTEEYDEEPDVPTGRATLSRTNATLNLDTLSLKRLSSHLDRDLSASTTGE